ncbi:hypothetical protein KEG38_03400 [Polyangium jinanense]|uniref:hypothetical protein n=1 Tax=Polyangium jinanense TaxID=2829994 RepID=UPI0023421029|nr:hypothetical protein [Polyangium jinanense]MDC3952870.1 hypothetical protein [Polyangium jinanense]
MISGHIGAGQYILFQRDPRVPSAPLLEVGRLVVTELDGDTRYEHWFLYTSAPVGSGYAAYIRPSSAFLGTPVGLSLRGTGAPPPEFNVNDCLAWLSLSTGCGVAYIEARCARLASNDAGSISAAIPRKPQQVDLGIYDITQGSRRVGVLVVTRIAGGTLETWHLFDRVPTSTPNPLSAHTQNEGPYSVPDANIGGTYALTYLGAVSAPDLSGHAVVTVNALCAVAA